MRLRNGRTNVGSTDGACNEGSICRMKQTAGGGQAAELKYEKSRIRRREALELVKQRKILGNSYARGGTLTYFGYRCVYTAGTLPLLT